MAYGSWARGDVDEHSDLDVLALNYISPGKHPIHENISFSSYSESQLRATSGTLFGYHLKRDGKILLDRNNDLAQMLASIDSPDPTKVAYRIKGLTPVIDASRRDLVEHIVGLTKVARYLLRSALYTKALQDGAPCFSVKEIATRNRDMDLIPLLSSHKKVQLPASEETFLELRSRLHELCGGLKSNPFGSLEELAEGTWSSDRDLSNFAAFALHGFDDEIDYDALDKVVL
ncbi:hypothetical protein GCM10027456_00880 [Kineosporia babensis]